MKPLCVVFAVLSLIFVSANMYTQSSSGLSLEQIVYADDNHEKNFEKFLSNWEKEYVPKDVSHENDTVKAVYALYQMLFTPFDLGDKASFDGGADINSGYRNVIVPGSFGYYVTPSGTWDYKAHPWQAVSDFRPKLDLGHKARILYLTAKYDTMLNKFLGGESTEFGTPNIMSPARAKGQSAERETFVKKYLPIVHGHWGAYWHIATMPSMTFVFNPTFDKVEVKFRVVYGGRIYHYEKKDGKWQQVKDKYIEDWVE